ncbi:MAG: hypothetical protein LBJ00_13460 [Planctomycetaceae bacterium]|jgi:hypothetical protein|nr:hypothetical protein [Planctomycetaceae bacterium]
MIRNIQNLIENIRTTISFPETVAPDQIRQYARDYAEACVELNHRMMQCFRHIRNGNIAEGIRLAEMKPNLIEMYISLDFVEREEWNEIVSTLGYNVPPPLPVEQQRELNNAYLNMSPLEPLLRWHRLHALNGSPIRERLAVLRAIAKNDQQNSFWVEDQETFEKVRLKELDNEIKNAIATNNFAQIQSLYSELSSPDWVVSPPSEYRQKLCTIILRSLSELLLKYFNAFSYDEAVAVYTKMQKLLTNTNMPMPPEIRQTIRAAVFWLAETQQRNELQKTFNKSASDLNDALEAESSVPVLEQLHYALLNAAAQADTTIPKHLEERYQSQIDSCELQRSRRIKIMVTSAACVCIFIGVLIIWGLASSNFNRTVAQTLKSLQDLETEKRYEDIPGIIQRIEHQHNGISANPQIASAFEKLRNLYDYDQKRAEEFMRYHNQASEALDNISELDQQNAEPIKTAVAQTEKRVRTPQEKILFTELKRRYDAAALNLKTKLNAEYNKEIETISNDFNELCQNKNLTPDDMIFQLAKLSLRINTLQQQYTDTSQTLQKQSNILLNSITNYETQIKSELEQNDSFKKLVNKTSKITDYKDALEFFVTKFPQHPATADAEEVVKELDDVKAVLDLLRKLTTKYSESTQDVKKLQNNSSELLTALNELTSKISGSPDQLFPPAPYLRMLTEKQSYSQDTFKSTKTFLQNLTQKKVWRWIKKENWYYLTKKPEKPDKIGGYEYITTFASETKPISIYESEFKPEKVPNNSQADFSIEALKKLDNISTNAVEVVCDLIGELVKSNDIDPILKYLLLELLITDTSAIDPIFEMNFKRCLEIISTSNVEKETNWMDVDSKNTILQRNLATVMLSRIPNVDQLIEKTKKEHEQFKNLIGKFNLELECVGILVQKNHEWHCNLKSALTSKTGTLYIFRKKPDDTVLPVQIGNNSELGIQLTGNENLYLQCVPVFLKR